MRVRVLRLGLRFGHLDVLGPSGETREVRDPGAVDQGRDLLAGEGNGSDDDSELVVDDTLLFFLQDKSGEGADAVVLVHHGAGRLVHGGGRLQEEGQGVGYRIALYRVVSYRTVSYRVVSYCIVSCRRSGGVVGEGEGEGERDGVASVEMTSRGARREDKRADVPGRPPCA